MSILIIFGIAPILKEKEKFAENLEQLIMATFRASIKS